MALVIGPLPGSPGGPPRGGVAGSLPPPPPFRIRVQCRQIQVQIPIPKISTNLPTPCRQVGIVGWRPIIGTDCRPVTIMELTSDDGALLLIASENVHLKLKRERERERERSRVHEINQLRDSMVKITTFSLTGSRWGMDFSIF